MSAKKKSPRKKKKNSSSLFKFLALVIVLAIISMAVAYYIDHTDNPNRTEPSPTEMLTNKDQDETALAEIKTTIEGTWVSNYDGVMLTISGLTFTMESPSVETSSNVKGTLSVENNIVTFVNTSGSEPCKNKEGHYLFVLDEKGDLKFNLIKDSCASRVERMSVSWYRI